MATAKESEKEYLTENIAEQNQGYLKWEGMLGE